MTTDSGGLRESAARTRRALRRAALAGTAVNAGMTACVLAFWNAPPWWLPAAVVVADVAALSACLAVQRHAMRRHWRYCIAWLEARQ